MFMACCFGLGRSGAHHRVGSRTGGKLRQSAGSCNAEIGLSGQKSGKKTLHRSQIVLSCAHTFAKLALSKPAVFDDTESL
jgi:hypothetical protein